MSEKALSRYIEKMYELQYNQQEKILTPAEMKEVALDMGFSEEEWQQQEGFFNGHLKNGQTMVLQRNWNGAIQELDSATALNPYHVDAVYSYAQALVGRFQEQGSPEDAEKAREMVTRVMRVQPGHAPSLKLLSVLEKREQSSKESGKSNQLLKKGIGIALAVILVLSAIGLRNGVVKEEEKVSQAWAQVENAYERRAALIPQLVNVVKGATGHEKELIEKLGKLQSQSGGVSDASSQEAFNSAYMTQMAISTALRGIVTSTQGTSVGSSQAFRDLMVQLEGSENRIAVERKKYNESVQSYNTTIRQFPSSLFSGSPKPYFQASKGAMETPEVKF